MWKQSPGPEDLFRALETWFHDKNEWWDGRQLDGILLLDPRPDSRLEAPAQQEITSGESR